MVGMIEPLLLIAAGAFLGRQAEASTSGIRRFRLFLLDYAATMAGGYYLAEYVWEHWPLTVLAWWLVGVAAFLAFVCSLLEPTHGRASTDPHP